MLRWDVVYNTEYRKCESKKDYVKTILISTIQILLFFNKSCQNREEMSLIN